jgi:hypothetical protein
LWEDKDYTQDELSILVTNTPKMILKTLVLSDNKAISLNNEKDLRAELNIKWSRWDNLVASMSITPEAYSALINWLINEWNFEKQWFSDKFFNSLIRNLRSDRNDDTNNSFWWVRIWNITKETFWRLIHTKHAWLVSLFEERNDLPDWYQTLLFERIKDFEPNRSSSTVTKLILTDKFENNDELRYLIESLQAKWTQQYNKVKDIINDIKTKIDLDRSLWSLRNKKTTRITINNESIEISDEKVYKLHNLFTKEKTKSL